MPDSWHDPLRPGHRQQIENRLPGEDIVPVIFVRNAPVSCSKSGRGTMIYLTEPVAKTGPHPGRVHLHPADTLDQILDRHQPSIPQLVNNQRHKGRTISEKSEPHRRCDESGRTILVMPVSWSSSQGAADSDVPSRSQTATSIYRQSGMAAIAHHFRDVGDCGRRRRRVACAVPNVFDGDIANTKTFMRASSSALSAPAPSSSSLASTIAHRVYETCTQKSPQPGRKLARPLPGNAIVIQVGHDTT